MDILLIYPRMAHARRIMPGQDGWVLPMTLLYLARPLVQKGFSVGILDLRIESIDRRGFAAYIEAYRPRLVGITCTTASYSNALAAAQCIKESAPETKIVVGGPHVTFTAEDTLKNECFDVVVRGEGDRNFTQLAEHFLRDQVALDQIRGISFRVGGEIVQNPVQRIEDIDSLGFPSREGIDLSRYSMSGVIFASRGCPFQCRFCSAGAMAGGKYRMRSVRGICEEIDHLVLDRGIRYIGFLDDTVTVYPEVTGAICRHIIDLGVPVQWICESRVDVADIELLRSMAAAGCSQIQFGFESGSEAILKSIRKNITPAQMIGAVERCLSVGIKPVGNFMIGFPDDTHETIAETLALSKHLKQMGAYASLVVLTPFPGTYIYDHRDELGLTLHSSDWNDFDLQNPVISTRHLSVDDLRTYLFDFSPAPY